MICRSTNLSNLLTVFISRSMRLIVKMFILASFCSSCTLNAQEMNRDLFLIQDSLDKIILPPPMYNVYEYELLIHVNNQEQWNNISEEIVSYLKKGYRNICFQIDARELELSSKMKDIEGLNYPEASIRIVGNGVRFIPEGAVFCLKNSRAKKGKHYAMPYSQFNINDVIFDTDNNHISLYGKSFLIKSDIEPVVGEGEERISNADGSLYKYITRIWRFKTDLPNINEEQCGDFYLLLTRDWISCRHKVVKVENGYLYFQLKSNDALSLKQLTMDPNSDQIHYRHPPRCCLINCPITNGVYIKGDSLYVPKRIKSIRIGKAGKLFTMNNCHFNFFEISGFHVFGSGNQHCVTVQSSSFADQMWIKDNYFNNLSANAIRVIDGENVSIFNNFINSTRINAIWGAGKRISIWQNRLSNIGVMSQNMAIAFAGTDIHVFENTIENFNYCAIGSGGAQPNNQCTPKTYIIEHNVIRYSQEYSRKIINLADAGGIYIGPQNTQGIIRNNIIENISGIGANRGIFLDDGAKNLAVYCNLIINTRNSYDIDLRFCDTYSHVIPDHNTNNIVIHNILTGGYRFQDTGKEDCNCLGGQNLLIGTGPKQLCVVNVLDGISDLRLSGCKIKKGKITIPRKYSFSINSIHFESSVKERLLFR